MAVQDTSRMMETVITPSSWLVPGAPATPMLWWVVLVIHIQLKGPAAGVAHKHKHKHKHSYGRSAREAACTARHR